MSTNVFADIGLPDPELQLTKARIVAVLRRLIREKELTDQAASRLLGVENEAMQGLMRGLWEDYTVDQLLRFVNALSRNVRIIIDDQDVAVGEEAQTLVLTA